MKVKEYQVCIFNSVMGRFADYEHAVIFAEALLRKDLSDYSAEDFEVVIRRKTFDVIENVDYEDDGNEILNFE